MAQEVVKVIKIETAGGQQTVKDLKNEIKSLRDDLLNVNKGTKEYDDIVKKLIDDEKQLTDVMRAGKNEVSAATGSYNALQNELTSLKKVWKEVTDETQRAEIGQRIAQLNQELKDMDATIGNHQRDVGNYENAIRNVTAEYTSQRAELKALRVELEQLDPGTEAYNTKFQRAAEITHNLTEQQEKLKYASNDLGDQLGNLRGIAANVAAGFSAAQAAIGLFGGESNEVQQAMLKVQQAMALVQGLQGLDGFIKRTQGLSTAIKGWVTQTKAATVATQAETVATQGATVAQKGLNAAMKANPIGIIIGLLALLVANWKKLTEWLGKAVGGWDKVTKAMNKFKQVAVGVGNAIKKVLLVPVKEAINYVATLGKVLKDVFTLNWDNIGKDIKDGINNSIEIVKDGYNVVGNFVEGKEKEITRQVTKETKERAEKRADELEKIIENKQAELGEDWKYTEEAKTMYDEMFDKRMSQYDKDSEEYRKAQNDKLKYDREFTEHQEKQRKANIKSSADAAKKVKEDLKKIESDYQSKVSNQIGSDLGNIYAEYDEKYKAFTDYYNNLAKALDKSANVTDKKLAAWLKHYTDEIEKYNNLFKRDNQRIINETKAFLKGLSIEEFGDFFKQSAGEDYWEKQFGKLTDEKKLEKWNDWVERMGEKTALSFSLGLKMRFINERNRIEKLYNSIVNDSIENSSREANSKINDEIIKLFQKTIVPNVDDELAKLQLEIGKKTIKLDFEIETGLDGDAFIDNEDYIPIKNFDKRNAELERATAIYQNSIKQLLVQRNYYLKTVDFVNDNGLIPSDAYKEAVAKIEEIDNQLNQIHTNYYNTNAEIRDKYFAEDLQKIQTNAANEERLILQHYNELYTANSNYLNGRRQLSGVIMEHDIQAADETYQVQKNALQEQLNMYQSYLQDVTVAGEQRVEAEKMVAELIAEIEEGEVAHTREMNELRIQSFQGWFNYAQEAINGIGDLFGGLADYYEADIKAKQANNEISEEEANEMYEKVKALKISEAIISTISGAIGAFMQAVSAYPPPWGEILGGVSAAAVTAAGMAQVAQIKQQQLGSSGGSVKAIATPQTQVYQPDYVESLTGDSEISNLRNSYMNQPIKAYVVESEITDSQRRSNTRQNESSF